MTDAAFAATSSAVVITAAVTHHAFIMFIA
jgi:hypothetical protein